MLTLRTFLIASFFAVLLINVEGNELCGSKNCEDDEVCETSIDGGTCIHISSTILCSNFTFCYKPRMCCGYDTCCPENSVCCDYKCCPDDSYCEYGTCVPRGVSKWWYGFFVIIPLIGMVAI